MSAALRLRNGLRHTESPMSATLHCGVAHVGMFTLRSPRGRRSPRRKVGGVRKVPFCALVESARSAESARSPAAQTGGECLGGKRISGKAMAKPASRGHPALSFASQSRCLRKEEHVATPEPVPPSLVSCRSKPMSLQGKHVAKASAASQICPSALRLYTSIVVGQVRTDLDSRFPCSRTSAPHALCTLSTWLGI
jgi:hypothetical protein